MQVELAVPTADHSNVKNKVLPGASKNSVKNNTVTAMCYQKFSPKFIDSPSHQQVLAE
jgi:hypothetical protein